MNNLKYNSSIKKIISLNLLLLLFFIMNLSAVDGSFSIITLNDTHSQLFPWKDTDKQIEYGGAARWATVIKNIKNMKDDVLVLHAGDFLTGSDSNYLINHSPNWERIPTYGYRGLVDIALLNILGVDAACIGNHEFDFGLYWLFHCLKSAKFDLLSANLSYHSIPNTTEYEDETRIKPYTIYKKDGISIAVIGLTTDEFIKTSQVLIKNPQDVVQSIIEEIGDKATVFVILSHLGKGEDIELARNIPSIDIIVGGHSHSKITQPIYVGDTIITQTGAFGESLGILDILVVDSKVSDVTYSLIHIGFDVVEDDDVKSFLNNFKNIGVLEKTLVSSIQEQSSMGEFVAKKLRETFSSNFGLFSSRLAIGEIEAGVVSAQDFFSVFWPYRLRSYGPEKDMTPTQVLNILHNKAPRLARKLLYIADGLSNIIKIKCSPSTIKEIIEYNTSVLVGHPDYLQLDGSIPKDSSELSIVMDLQAYRSLLDGGILDDSMPYSIYDYELFEIIMNSFDINKSHKKVY